jgi:hypothetical protein
MVQLSPSGILIENMKQRATHSQRSNWPHVLVISIKKAATKTKARARRFLQHLGSTPSYSCLSTRDGGPHNKSSLIYELGVFYSA